MPKIAIAIVLLPDKLMSDYAIRTSEKQSKIFNQKILLNKEKCLPHISLAMGAIDESLMPKIKNILENITANFDKFELKADSYNVNTIPSGEKISEFTVKKTVEIQKIHETIMNELKAFLKYDVSIDMIYSPPPAEEITLHWIRNYAKESSFDHFKPHITIGFGNVKGIKTPIDFTASTLAICHLGNYCTCRKILYSLKLNKVG